MVCSLRVTRRLPVRSVLSRIHTIGFRLLLPTTTFAFTFAGLFPVAENAAQLTSLHTTFWCALFYRYFNRVSPRFVVLERGREVQFCYSVRSSSFGFYLFWSILSFAFSRLFWFTGSAPHWRVPCRCGSVLPPTLDCCTHILLFMPLPFCDTLPVASYWFAVHFDFLLAVPTLHYVHSQVGLFAWRFALLVRFAHPITAPPPLRGSRLPFCLPA